MTHNQSMQAATGHVGFGIQEGEPFLVCKEDMEPKPKTNKRQPGRRNLHTNTNHDPFILKFPPEIASHIFFLSMEERDYKPESFELPNLKMLPTPFILGSVCQGWRQLAWSTPKLWSMISFTLAKLPKRKNLKTLLFINDWLQRSRSLPLDLWVYDYEGDKRPSSREQYDPIIDALNQHSGRWHALCLRVTKPAFLRLFGGTFPPSNIRSLQLITEFDQRESPTFRMNSRPSPTHLTIRNIPLSNIDIVWDNLEYLEASHPDLDLDRCMELMQRAPLLKSCSLSMFIHLGGSFPPKVPTTIVRHMRLRKLEIQACSCLVDVFVEFLNLMELPSLEEYHYQSNEDDILADSVASLINRSGSHLKVLKLELDKEAPAMEAINKLLNAVPHLQEFRLRLEPPGPKTAFVMDDLFLQLSSSPPVLAGGTPGLLPDLQFLELYSGEGYMFDCIPDIFSWPHRKTLKLQIDGSRNIVLRDDTSHKISNLIDQGFRIRILKEGWNYFPYRSLV